VHQPVRRHRVFPGERLVDARGAAIGPEREILGAAHKAQMRAVERAVGPGMAMRRGMGARGLGIGWLEAKAAGHLDRAEQDLQDVQRARRLEAVGMGRDAAHGVKADRAARHGLMRLAAEIGPFVIEGDRLVKGDAGDFGGDAADLVWGHAATVRHRLGRVLRIEIALGHQVHDRAVRDAVRLMCGREVGVDAGGVEDGGPPGLAVDHQRLATLVAKKKPVFGRGGIAVHQHRRVGVAGEVIEVDLARLHQFVNERQDEKPVRARRDPHPVIGHGVIAGADRVDADDACTARLELTDAHLDRVAVVILGHAEQDEKPCVVPIRLAELPERPAHGVDPRCRHVDRAEAAMRRIVGRAEILRPEAGEALGLIAPGEEGEP